MDVADETPSPMAARLHRRVKISAFLETIQRVPATAKTSSSPDALRSAAAKLGEPLGAAIATVAHVYGLPPHLVLDHVLDAPALRPTPFNAAFLGSPAPTHGLGADMSQLMDHSHAIAVALQSAASQLALKKSMEPGDFLQRVLESQELQRHVGPCAITNARKSSVVLSPGRSG